ncbi:MAG: SoxR reducing system RseC family protein [Candidatus Saccharibacteria bacterium]
MEVAHLTTRRKRYLSHAAVIAVMMLIGALSAHHQGQDLSWDLLNYHFYNPWAFVHGRMGFDYAPAGGGTYANPMLDVLDYFFRANFRPIIAGLCIGAVQGLNGYVVFAIAHLSLRKYLPDQRLRFAVSLGLGVASLFGATAYGEMGASQGDTIISLFVLGSLLLLLYAANSDNRNNARIQRLAAYALIGMAVGLKLTALVFAIPLIIAGAFIGDGIREKLRFGLQHVGAFILGILVIAGFWYAKMWALFHNPVFPYYNAIFRSPYLPPVNLSDTRWFPHTLHDKILWPFIIARLQNVAAEPLFRDPRLAIMLTTVAIAVVVYIIRRFIQGKSLRIELTDAILLVFVVLSYVIWQIQFSYYRYASPLEILSFTVVAVAAYKFMKSKIVVTVGLAALCIAATMYTVPLNFGRIPWQTENFGPNLSKQLSVVNNGIVLLPVRDPMGFLVPYLPKNTRAISVLGYATANSLQRQPIASAIQDAQKHGKQFYALISNQSLNTDPTAFTDVGYKVTKCQVLDTWITQYASAGRTWYSVCALEKIQA